MSYYNARYTSTKTQTRFKKTYLFMINDRFQRYSHLPHQVANIGINCYDTRLSKCKKKIYHKNVSENVTIQSMYMIMSHITIKY